MKRMIPLACACLLLLLAVAPAVLAADMKCPPDEAAVQKFCKENHADRADECVKAILAADCGQDTTAAGKAQGDKVSGAAVLKKCMEYGGGFFGCAFWLAVSR
jgi:hypothetical protein